MDEDRVYCLTVFFFIFFFHERDKCHRTHTPVHRTIPPHINPKNKKKNKMKNPDCIIQKSSCYNDIPSKKKKKK